MEDEDYIIFNEPMMRFTRSDGSNFYVRGIGGTKGYSSDYGTIETQGDEYHYSIGLNWNGSNPQDQYRDESMPGFSEELLVMLDNGLYCTARYNFDSSLWVGLFPTSDYCGKEDYEPRLINVNKWTKV